MRRRKTIDQAIAYIDGRYGTRPPRERIVSFHFGIDGSVVFDRKPNAFAFDRDESSRLSPRTVKFIQRPDPPKRDECRILRKERISPLTIIAEKWEDRDTFNPYPDNGRTDAA